MKADLTSRVYDDDYYRVPWYEQPQYNWVGYVALFLLGAAMMLVFLMAVAKGGAPTVSAAHPTPKGKAAEHYRPMVPNAAPRTAAPRAIEAGYKFN